MPYSLIAVNRLATRNDRIFAVIPAKADTQGRDRAGARLSRVSA